MRNGVEGRVGDRDVETLFKVSEGSDVSSFKKKNFHQENHLFRVDLTTLTNIKIK